MGSFTIANPPIFYYFFLVVRTDSAQYVIFLWMVLGVLHSHDIRSPDNFSTILHTVLSSPTSTFLNGRADFSISAVTFNLGFFNISSNYWPDRISFRQSGWKTSWCTYVTRTVLFDIFLAWLLPFFSFFKKVWRPAQVYLPLRLMDW